MFDTINKYKVDALVIAVGVTLGIIGANIAQSQVAKVVELGQCLYYAPDAEKLTHGKGTLSFSYFGGCQLTPTGK